MGKTPAPSVPAYQPPATIIMQQPTSSYVPPSAPDLPALPASNVAAVPSILEAGIITDEADLRAAAADEQAAKTSIADTIVTSPLIEDDEIDVLKTVLG